MSSGLWRKASAPERTPSCGERASSAPVRTTTGMCGLSRVRASNTLRPVIPGSSRSRMTQSGSKDGSPSIAVMNARPQVNEITESPYDAASRCIDRQTRTSSSTIATIAPCSGFISANGYAVRDFGCALARHSVADELAQPGHIFHLHFTPLHLDNTVVLQAREQPGHRLDRKAEVAGYFLTHHTHVETTTRVTKPLMTIGKGHQECGEAL